MRAVGRLPRYPNICNNSTSANDSTTDIKGDVGSADALFISNNIPKPTPSKGEAIVKIKAFGLNRMDLLQREGKYPLPPQAGKILGVEFSGIIEELGSETKEHFKVGDEVFGLAYGGAYAEYIQVSSRMLMHKPKDMSWEEAAGIPEVCSSPFKNNIEEERK